MNFAFLFFVAIALSSAFYIYRRRTYGDQRGAAVMYATIMCGGILCLTTFLFFRPVFGTPRGMGYELFIYPAGFLIGGFVLSPVLGLLVIAIEGRWLNDGKDSSALNDRELSALIERDASLIATGSGHDWREFAASIARPHGGRQ